MSSIPLHTPSLLLVDDDTIIAESLEYVLSDEYAVSIASDRKGSIRLLKEMDAPPELALVDLGLPPDTHKPDEGFAVIEYINEHFPSTRVLVLSGQDENKYVEAAKTLGAADFVAKPCDVAELKVRLKRQLQVEASPTGSQQQAMGIIGESAEIELLRMQIKQLADSPYPVIIQGGSGSGKELTAQNLHTCSQRSEQPFLTLNCAAFNGELLESQLFGHAKGAFTGATETKKGFFEEADQGTLFLDEIADLPLDLQAKLLRVLENGEYYRLGETHPRIAEARVLTASNKNLLEEIDNRRFREDLYHRLSVLRIRVPDLHERGDDKIILLKHFLKQLDSKLTTFSLDQASSDLWQDYQFPGNVRELRNIIIRLSAKYPGQTIKRAVLEKEMNLMSSRRSDKGEVGIYSERLKTKGFDLDNELKQIEKKYIDLALEMSSNNMSKAANLLGVNRSTLYGRLDRDEEKS